MSGEIILAILGILGGLTTGIAALVTATSTARGAAKKSELDTLRTIIDTQAAELTRLRQAMDKLIEENNALRLRNATLQDQVNALQDEVDKLRRKSGKGWQS